MRFRFRSAAGQKTLEDATLTGSSPISDLHSAAAVLLGISNPASVQIKAGFPPKLLGPPNASLASLGLKGGEQLTVETVAASTTPPAAPAPVKMPMGLAQSSPAVQPIRTDQPRSQAGSAYPGRTATVAAVEAVPVLGGTAYMIRREMPDDNSCLFNSIQYLLDRSASIPQLRQKVARAIQANPQEFNDAILGMPVQEYTRKLLMPNAWGGAIELAAFSQIYNVEICSVDVQTQRPDQFGQGRFAKRVYMLYSGIHYDAFALAPDMNADPAYDETVLDSAEDLLLIGAIEVAGILKKEKKFTDLANFTLRCSVCRNGLRGQVEAQKHAKETGHARFEEYS